MKPKYLRKRFKLIKANKKMLPIVYIYRSNKYTSGQCLQGAKILSYSTDRDVETKEKTTKMETARIAGEKLGESLKQLGIKECIFDIRGKKFFGRVKSFVEGVRSKL